MAARLVTLSGTPNVKVGDTWPLPSKTGLITGKIDHVVVRVEPRDGGGLLLWCVLPHEVKRRLERVA